MSGRQGRSASGTHVHMSEQIHLLDQALLTIDVSVQSVF